jgi:predicted nucleic acid-binding protein
MNKLRQQMEYLKNRLRLVNIADIPNTLLKQANKIVCDIDERDTYFIAMHLFTGHKIWTGDRNLSTG